MMRAFSSERALGQCHGMIHGEGYGLCGWTQSPLFHFNIRLWWWVKEQAGAQTGSWAQCVIPPFIYTIFFISAIFCPWLDFGLPPQYPQAVWRHWREIEPFSAMLDGLAECDQPGNTPPRPGIEPGLRGGQTERYIHSPLSYHAQGRGEDRQWDTFILPLSYHDPGHGENRQRDTIILPLSYHDQGHGEDRQRDTFILPLSYHDPGHGENRQWDTFILPLSYHDQGHGEDRQRDTFILPLSYHDWLRHIPNAKYSKASWYLSPGERGQGSSICKKSWICSLSVDHLTTGEMFGCFSGMGL